MIEQIGVERTPYAVRLIARSLLLMPLVPVLLALTTPMATLDFGQLDKPAPEPLTLRGLVGEFGDMRSAFGVKPLLVLLIVALAGLFLGCCGVALGGRDGIVPETTWQARSALLLKGAAVAVIVSALPLPIFLGSADHVDQDIRHPPFEPHVQAWGFALLAAALSLALVGMIRRVEDAA